ncbi:B12-binding domain-containing radical SAM protein [Brassicibacter mesophilus]|uniref:B12-binding domain-containing radical SAM protein n=1 Tax=Brassicibacter mesophilus TaxID=745119 RepID=UPI003D1A75B5
MKILITTLNSKYIHTSLSIRYLKSYCENDFPNIEIDEYTINQNNEYISSEIFRKSPDVVAFACYIWNIESTLDIAQRLKIVNPNIRIILGGPEVSFDGKSIVEKNPFIDFIIFGEGEETFKVLLTQLSQNGNDFSDIEGLIYRQGNEIYQNAPRPLIENLDTIPSPFIKGAKDFENRIVYFESSRGCPFNCRFCLSSTIKGVRYFSIERVKQDLKRLIDAKVKQVKFVDRTFNAKKEYALEIMQFIVEQNVTDINFHFEVTAHLLDDDILSFLEHIPKGLFQFEIGVQSTNPATLEIIDRNTDFEKLKKVTSKIKSYNNIHQHLDLIAGLPHENYNTFRKSFNDVYSLRADKLQLGFLKLLKGSGLRQDVEKYGFKFLDKPPYEVLENNYITYNQLLKLKGIEDLVEKYGNEFYFENSINFIIYNYYDTPFDFYSEFSEYWQEKGHQRVSHSRTELYRILFDFYLSGIENNLEIFKEVLRFDFIYNNKSPNVPKYIKNDNSDYLKKQKHDFLKNEDNVSKYIPKHANLPAKKIINDVYFEEFNLNILDFIKYKYDLNNIKYSKSIILFVYDFKNVFNRCQCFNVTDEFKKIGSDCCESN